MTSNNMEYLTIALPKGKLFSLSADLLAKIGYTAEGLSDKSRKLVITNEEKKIRFIVSKTADVPTYVEYGAADIGIIGKDVLLESGKDVYELLDLGFGRCHLMMLYQKPRSATSLSITTIRASRRSSRISRSSSSTSMACRWSTSSSTAPSNSARSSGSRKASSISSRRGRRSRKTTSRRLLHPRCNGTSHRQPRELQAQI